MVIFAYDFPHKKTVDFIFHSLVKGYKVEAIIAAPPVKLNIPKSSIRSKLRHEPSYHPKDVADRFNLPYLVSPHNSLETELFLADLKPDVGLIGGARILKPQIIKQFSKGIINFHPGLIPEARGLDALFWSIINNVDLGVTSHLIDERIDAGQILEVKKIPLNLDDTLFDLSERLYEIQIAMIDMAIKNTIENNVKEIDYSNTQYNGKMPSDLELKVESALNEYLLNKLK